MGADSSNNIQERLRKTPNTIKRKVLQTMRGKEDLMSISKHQNHSGCLSRHLKFLERGNQWQGMR